MMQTFAIFVDRSAMAKIRTANFSGSSYGLLVVWSRQSASAKLRTTKFSSEWLGGNSMKFCTSDNFPLYGSTTTQLLIMER